jgi:PIN domain nuclease of toxin-antitoxin system
VDLLLDTHVFLWWNMDHARLGEGVQAAVADPQNRIVVSAAGVWEISIKRMIGKLAFQHDTLHAIANGGFEALAITPEHADAAGSLPLHHNDPFDRLLIAQTKLENLVLVTQDHQLLSYGVPLLGVS